MDRIYTENEVQNLLATGYRTSWTDALRFPVSDFVKIYFAQEGYKDGLHGLVLSLLQAFYSFLVFVKLWQLQEFKEEDIALPDAAGELTRSGKEVWYWMLTARLKETKHITHKLWFKLMRRYVTKN